MLSRFQLEAQQILKVLLLANRFVADAEYIVPASICNKKRTPLLRCSFWQGQKGSNPRHAVLETAALPTELYPYIKFGGPSGTRTPDRPVMSRLL